MDFKLITNEEQMLQEKENWNKICESMNYSTIFQTWEWNYFWWINNESIDALFVIKAFENNTIFGYAPLVVKNNIVEFIGGKDMDYGMFVVSQKVIRTIEGFVQLIKKKGYSLVLQEMPARNEQIHFLQKILENRKKYLCHKTTRSIYVDTNRYQSFDDYYNCLSKSMRNKTIKVGLKNNYFLQKEEVTKQLFDEIKEIYGNRQEMRGGASDITWAFPIIEELNKKKLLNVYIARNKNEAIGFLVSMYYKHTQYIWLVAFKKEYSYAYPGQLLFYQAIKDGFESDDIRIDFMRGDYDFKIRWDCAIDTNYTIYLYQKYIEYFKKKIYFYVRPKVKKIIYTHKSIERIYKKYV